MPSTWSRKREPCHQSSPLVRLRVCQRQTIEFSPGRKPWEPMDQPSVKVRRRRPAEGKPISFLHTFSSTWSRKREPCHPSSPLVRLRVCQRQTIEFSPRRKPWEPMDQPSVKVRRRRPIEGKPTSFLHTFSSTWSRKREPCHPSSPLVRLRVCQRQTIEFSPGRKPWEPIDQPTVKVRRRRPTEGKPTSFLHTFWQTLPHYCIVRRLTKHKAGSYHETIGLVRTVYSCLVLWKNVLETCRNVE